MERWKIGNEEIFKFFSLLFLNMPTLKASKFPDLGHRHSNKILIRNLINISNLNKKLLEYSKTF